MVLELHIWGPAYGLPSIDANCLAAVAYFRRCLPVEAWVLIPSSDPSISPLLELPALRNENVWVAGYKRIVKYLRDYSEGDWDLDKDLTSTQRADRAAFTSFLESRGQPLLDLSLFVSSENYFTCTRPAFGKILTWPNSWFIPHRLRDKAKRRSEHLGLSALDVDTAQDDKSKDEGLTGQIPQSLRKPKKTVSAILGKDIRKNRFRLDAVTGAFLEPVEEMLHGKTWLLGDNQSSVDFLAIAYLVLMRGPADLPQSWISDTMKRKHPKLIDWASRGVSDLFGSPASTQKAGEDDTYPALPWRKPEERTLLEVTNAVLLNTLDYMPILGTAFGQPEIETRKNVTRSEHCQQRQLALTKIHNRHLLYGQILGTSVCFATITATLFWNGLLTLPRRAPRQVPRTFGEAGSFLGLG